MSDDWRLRIELHDSGVAGALTDRLAASELEHDLESGFEDRVVVSRDGTQVFAYADSREQAERAERSIRALASRNEWKLDTELACWHPDAQEWEPPEQPLPQTDAQEAAERAQRLAKERQEAAEQGYPVFEVRVQCPSHELALQVARELDEEGIRSVRRSHYLLIGAADEDSASALASRLRDRAPSGCEVTIEGTGREVLQNAPANPFAFFGGLAA